MSDSKHDPMSDSKPETDLPAGTGVSPRPAFDMGSVMREKTFPQWIAPAALLLGAVGTVLSLWALKSASDSSAARVAGEGKAGICSAFTTASRAISLQTNGGAEPLPEPLAATNSRQALIGGGEYLLARVDSSTPRDLAEAVTAFADDVQTLGLNYLGGSVATDPAQADLIKRADAGMKSIADMCK